MCRYLKKVEKTDLIGRNKDYFFNWLLESQDGESQTTPANIVSQAEGSIARSTPDRNNNDTLGSISTCSEAGSVTTDNPTPIEEETDRTC